MSAFSKLMTMIGLVTIYFITLIMVAFIFTYINKLIPNLTTTMVCGYITFLLLNKLIINISNEITKK